MSKFDLRDVSQRLSESKDTEAVVYEFLGYLQSLRPDWRASLAFYEVSRDALVSVYLREGNRLMRRDIALPVDQLPARLVRKFFHSSAFLNAAPKRSLLAGLFRTSPFYEPQDNESDALEDVLPAPDWVSCVCLPLADQDDLLAMLVLTSPKKGAFPGRTVEDLVPVKGMAALALAQHLYRSQRPAPGAITSPAASGSVPEPIPAATDFQERIRQLDHHTSEVAAESQAKAERLEALAHEIEQMDRSSNEHRDELERVKDHLRALEEQSTAATEHLNAAYEQLTETQDRMAELQRTVGFLQDVFQVMSQEHDAQELSSTMVLWFSEHFGVERCSLMVVDNQSMLRIAAQRGIDPTVASRARVRVGQGISGWVAANRKPLFVRVKSDAREVQPTGQDVYNSDSFITVPLVHGDRVVGVLNLSNKVGGLPFDEMDLDRAMLTGSLLAMTLGAQGVAERAAAWA